MLRTGRDYSSKRRRGRDERCCEGSRLARSRPRPLSQELAGSQFRSRSRHRQSRRTGPARCSPRRRDLDHPFDGMAHPGGRRNTPHLTVGSHLHTQSGRIGNLVRGHDPRADRVACIEVLAPDGPTPPHGTSPIMRSRAEKSLKHAQPNTYDIASSAGTVLPRRPMTTPNSVSYCSWLVQRGQITSAS